MTRSARWCAASPPSNLHTHTNIPKGRTSPCADPNSNNARVSQVLSENPLTDFVELPEKLQPLSYCSLLCGVIRGALEQISMKVECEISKDPLKGDERFELHMRLVEYVNEEYPFKDD